jgi:hypothetical protein
MDHMSEKSTKVLEKLLRAELVELKGLRKDMRLIMRRLDMINESLAPISQEAKEELNCSALKRGGSELV